MQILFYFDRLELKNPEASEDKETKNPDTSKDKEIKTPESSKDRVSPQMRFAIF